MSDVSVFVIFSFTAADSRQGAWKRKKERESEREIKSDGNCKLDKLMEMLHVNGKLSYEENWTLT